MKGHTKRKSSAPWWGVAAGGFCGASLAMPLLFATGQVDIVMDSKVFRALLCLGLVCWGVGYYFAGKTRWNILFGLVQIAGATVSNWYQLGKIATDGKSNVIEHLMFVAVAIGVIAHGAKDMADGFDKLVLQKDIKPRSDESSASPALDSPTPE